MNLKNNDLELIYKIAKIKFVVGKNKTNFYSCQEKFNQRQFTLRV